jgi:hypothetical protein
LIRIQFLHNVSTSPATPTTSFSLEYDPNNLVRNTYHYQYEETEGEKDTFFYEEYEDTRQELSPPKPSLRLSEVSTPITVSPIPIERTPDLITHKPPRGRVNTVDNIADSIGTDGPTPPEPDQPESLQQVITPKGTIPRVTHTHHQSHQPQQHTQKRLSSGSTSVFHPGAEDDSIRNFEVDKTGQLIPVISTELRTKPKSNIDTNILLPKGEPEMYIDINLGDGRITQVGVRSGDNVFQLANNFVAKNKLDPSKIRDVAYLFRTSINKYLGKQGPPSVYSINSFNSSSQLSLEGSLGNSATKQADNTAILKLVIDLGPGKTGSIVVRKNDDPKILAKNFAATWGLKKWKEDEIAEEIRQQIAMLDNVTSEEEYRLKTHQTMSSSNNGSGGYFSHSTMATRKDHEELFEFKKLYHSNKNGESSNNNNNNNKSEDLLQQVPYLGPSDNMNRNLQYNENTKDVTNNNAANILFNMEVEIKQGMKRTLCVKKNEKAQDLAKAFALKYNLNKKAEDRLVNLVDYHIKRFHERNENKRRNK